MRAQRRTHMCAQQGKSARTEGHGGVSTGAQQGKSARMAVCMRQSMRLVCGRRAWAAGISSFVLLRNVREAAQDFGNGKLGFRK